METLARAVFQFFFLADCLRSPGFVLEPSSKSFRSRREERNGNSAKWIFALDLSAISDGRLHRNIRYNPSFLPPSPRRSPPWNSWKSCCFFFETFSNFFVSPSLFLFLFFSPYAKEIAIDPTRAIPRELERMKKKEKKKWPPKDGRMRLRRSSGVQSVS